MKKYVKQTFRGERVFFQSCNLLNTDLAFEYSTLEAVIDSNITSVKNHYSGKIKAKHIGEVIFDNTKMEKEDIEIITRDVKVVQNV